jgi:hypothetical protein
MGQRHQLYIKTKLSNNAVNNKAKTFAFHHSWFYGFWTIHKLKQLIEFELKQNQYEINKSGRGDKYFSLHSGDYTHNTIQAQQMLNSLISLNIETGSYRLVENLETNNPYETDNNDGQTFIDFFTENNKPLYGFAFPYEKDNENIIIDDNDNIIKKEYIVDKKRVKSIPPFIILSAREYVYKIYGRDVYNNGIIDYEFKREIEEVLNYIETNTELMSQEHFENIYGKDLEEENEINSINRINFSKNLKLSRKNDLLKVIKLEKIKLKNEQVKTEIKQINKENSNSELSEVTFY